MSKKKEALPRDGTLWIASYRDSLILIAQKTEIVKKFGLISSVATVFT